MHTPLNSMHIRSPLCGKGVYLYRNYQFFFGYRGNRQAERSYIASYKKHFKNEARSGFNLLDYLGTYVCHIVPLAGLQFASLPFYVVTYTRGLYSGPVLPLRRMNTMCHGRVGKKNREPYGIEVEFSVSETQYLGVMEVGQG